MMHGTLISSDSLLGGCGVHGDASALGHFVAGVRATFAGLGAVFQHWVVRCRC
jgi:hypothetical protein